MLEQNIPLKELTNYKIGGPARYFLAVSSKEELVHGLEEWRKIKTELPPETQKIFVLGKGTNLLVDDKGYNGLVIHSNIQTITKIKPGEVEFGSGMAFSEAIDYCTKQALSGFEWAGGLPGSVGGAVRGNAGAFGGEIKDNLKSVESLDLSTIKLTQRNNEQCRFSYRTSTFKEGEGKDEFIASASFCFQPGEPAIIKKKTEEKIVYRQEHQPLDLPSAGSTFKNVPLDQASKDLAYQCRDVIKKDPFPVIPVAYLLSLAGLKGKQLGQVKISEIHPNFLVNLGNASAKDVLALIALAQSEISKKFGLKIEPEIMYLKY